MPYQYLTTYLLNGTIALDAGSVGLLPSLEAQTRIRHIVITHSHIDHLATLPIFLENVYDGSGDCVTIHALPEVLADLQRDIFNGRLWPDFIAISLREPPFLKLAPLEPCKPFELEGLRLTPVPVNHVVPTVGLIVEDDDGLAVFPSDTGPTDLIWDLANLGPEPKAIYLEATFPESMRRLAGVSKHLTPLLYAEEIRKVRGAARFRVVHIKPRFHDAVVQELNALEIPGLEIVVPGKEYS